VPSSSGGPPSPAPPGLGLDLYLAKQLVEMHQGQLAVTSPGQGNRFVIRLPLAKPIGPDEVRNGPH